MQKKGFTMVELIVSLALAAILGMCVVSIVAPIYRIYHRTVVRADAQMVAGNVLDSIRQGVMNAGKVEATKDGAGVDVGRGVYKADAGYLVFEGSPVFDAKYYNGSKIQLKATRLGSDLVQVDVTVSGSEGARCTVGGIVSPLRTLFLDVDYTTPEGMYDAAYELYKKYIAGTSKQPNEYLFDLLYDAIQQLYGEFPQYSIYHIPEVTPQALQAFLKSCENKPGYYQIRNKINILLKDELKLATYYQSGQGKVETTFYPIVYLTDSSKAQIEKNKHGTTWMIYLDGKWYVPKNIIQYMGSAMLPSIGSTCATEADLRIYLTKPDSLWQPIGEMLKPVNP
ncbi:MAG: prepilin-type N-terminal cleavage/methylation domain-containing protein [Clostridia bacterium]